MQGRTIELPALFCPNCGEELQLYARLGFDSLVTGLGDPGLGGLVCIYCNWSKPEKDGPTEVWAALLEASK